MGIKQWSDVAKLLLAHGVPTEVVAEARFGYVAGYLAALEQLGTTTTAPEMVNTWCEYYEAAKADLKAERRKLNARHKVDPAPRRAEGR